MSTIRVAPGNKNAPIVLKMQRRLCRDALYVKQERKCALCFRECVIPGKGNYQTTPRNLFTLDHVKPLAEGGTDCMENYRGLCWTCNQQLGIQTQRKFPITAPEKS